MKPTRIQRDARTATMMVGTVTVDLCTENSVLSAVRRRLMERGGNPLAIGSVNLDHLHHFAGHAYLRDPAETMRVGVDWALLADGAPIVARAERLTGISWPRLAGSDLLPSILGVAEEQRCTVGFLGGRDEMHRRLAIEVAKRFPALERVGYWAPDRSEIDDPSQASALSREVREANVDVLVVGLGKPRQELWIDKHGVESGARVLLAFGAAADFLAGSVSRAPERIQAMGLEWLYRLGREPRRLARRYLIEGLPELVTLRRARLTPEVPSILEPPDLNP